MASLLPPADVVTEGPYDMKALDAPILQGSLLKLFIWFMKTPLYGSVHKSIARKSNVPQVLSEIQLPESPQFVVPWKLRAKAGVFPTAPLMDVDAASRARGTFLQLSHVSKPTTVYATVRDYNEAYRSGSTTPLETMEAIIAFVTEIEGQDASRRWFTSFKPADIRKQADASTQRWKAGTPLSPLDGVPFAVKDCLDALGHETTAGTAFLGKRRPVSEEMPAVKMLKLAGAILLGKTTMHEIGLGTTGLNLVHGTAYNPHDKGHYTGGSSSGSAGVVAAGICPFAIGTDGGGSIRIPASYCGLVGLKPTNSRVGHKGGPKLDFSVATSGPIAGTVEDCLLLYALMANSATKGDNPGPPPAVLPAPFLPPPSTPKPLEGLSVGVFWSWFEDANPVVVEKCKAAVQLMEQLGAKVSPCCIPELELLRVAHTATIVSEMYQEFGHHLRDPDTGRQVNLDVQASLLSASHFSATDYLQAQKIRARAACHFQRVFDTHDVIATPTTPTTAPAIPRGALRGGELNLNRTSESMRFVNQANMLGLPGISIPVGADAKGLPIGLQLIGQAWEEALLLRVGATLEARLPAAGVATPKPKMFINPLASGKVVHAAPAAAVEKEKAVQKALQPPAAAQTTAKNLTEQGVPTAAAERTAETASRQSAPNAEDSTAQQAEQAAAESATEEAEVKAGGTPQDTAVAEAEVKAQGAALETATEPATENQKQEAIQKAAGS